MAKKRTFDLTSPDYNRTRVSFGKKKGKKKTTKDKASQRIYDTYKHRFLDMITSFFEQEFGVVMEWVKDLLNMKNKLRKMTFYFIMLFAGTTIVLYGIAKYIDCLCTTLSCGASYVLVGLSAIIIALLYRRFF